MPEQPTPEELADRARHIGNAGGTDQDITDLVRDAEAGGPAHMTAVAAQVANWPVSAGLPAVYDTATGKPAYNESRVLIECRIRVEGQLATIREAIDPYMLAAYFTDPAELDRFVDAVLRTNFGALATDPFFGPIIKRKTWVIRPSDPHDFRRCHDSPRDTEAFRTSPAGPTLPPPESAALPPALNLDPPSVFLAADFVVVDLACSGRGQG